MRPKSDHRFTPFPPAATAGRASHIDNRTWTEIPWRHASHHLELMSLTPTVTLLRITHKRPHGFPGASHHVMSTTLPPPKKTSRAPDHVKEWFVTKGRAEGIPPVFVREWLGEVVKSHYRVFYSIAYGYVRNHSSAEDLVQSAVMKALQAIKKLNEPEAIVGWLAAITRNACLEEVRRKKGKFEEPVETIVALETTRKIDINRFETQKLVLEAINSLSENQAIAVRLRFLEDCDLDEIAERLGLRKNTVEVRIHRALSTLAKKPALRALRGPSQ
jgi:RNA polymerase sigma-70 factor (ECF subfamily)